MHLQRCAGQGTVISLCVLLGLALPVVGADDKPKLGFRTAVVERGSITATVQATGTLEPVEVVDIGAQVSGTILKFGVDPGDKSKTVDYGTQVEKGTVLAQIDPERYQVEVEHAKAAVQRAEADLLLATAQLNAAERAWERAQKLKDSKAITADDLDKAKATFEVAKATVAVSRAAVQVAQVGVRKAEIELRYCEIRSPVKGVVVDKRVNLGQTVTAALNAPSLFLIATDLKKMQIWVSVPEADIAQVRKGQPVQFHVDAFPKATFRGQVSQVRLNATMTQNAVTYTVVVDFDNADGKLLPYLTADVRFEVGQRKNVLLVPNAALRWRPQLAQVAADARDAYAKTLRTEPKDDKERAERINVWVEDKGFVRPVKVRLGLSDGRVTELVEGDLAEGKPVVVGVRAPDGDGEHGQAPARGYLPDLLIQPGPVAINRTGRLTVQDAAAIASACPAVAHAAPVIRCRTTVSHDGRSWVPNYIYGSTPAYLDVRYWELEAGEPFSERDTRNTAKVYLLGRTLARELFGSESPIGSYVRVGDTSLRVVGVLRRKGANLMGLDQDDLLLAPWTTAKYRVNKANEASNRSDDKSFSPLYPTVSAERPSDQPSTGQAGVAVDQIVARLVTPDEASAASEQITELLRKRHRIAEGRDNDFNIRDLNEWKRAFEVPPRK